MRWDPDRDYASEFKAHPTEPEMLRWRPSNRRLAYLSIRFTARTLMVAIVVLGTYYLVAVL